MSVAFTGTTKLPHYNPRPMSSVTHSYYEWQLSTLMLAYDTVDPIDRDDTDAHAKRQQACEKELYDLVQAVLPKEYLENPKTDFPPDVVVELTKATIRRAATIVAGG
jgi:hypothetical protein